MPLPRKFLTQQTCVSEIVLHKLGKELMDKDRVTTDIETAFKTQVQSDPKLRNAYLLVYSDKLGIDMLLAEGRSNDTHIHALQPNHLASVGKLFAATLMGILFDQGKLDYHDPIARYLDAELMKGLHVFKGTDYSQTITIAQLLKQTTGLADVFFPLLKQMRKGSMDINPRDAILWGKRNLKPKFPPGSRNHYGDTNYYLIGLIIESICAKPYHEVMHELIFDPLGMDQAWIFGYSKPTKSLLYPMAKVRLDGIDIDSIPEIYRMDYAGGGVVAPLPQYLVFFKALLEGNIVKPETLQLMLTDSVRMGFPMIGFDYGYSIWKFRPIPLLLPNEFVCWGCVGITGVFQFYHPPTQAILIGCFNDMSYKAKALRFMLSKVIKPLLSCE